MADEKKVSETPATAAGEEDHPVPEQPGLTASEVDQYGYEEASPDSETQDHSSTAEDPRASALSLMSDASSGGISKRHTMMERRGSLLRRNDSRRDHLQRLYLKRKVRSAVAKSMAHMDPDLSGYLAEAGDSDLDETSAERVLLKTKDSFLLQIKKEVEQDIDKDKDKDGEKLKEIKSMLRDYYKYAKKDVVHSFPLEVRMQNFTFTVPVLATSGKVQTVYNSSVLYRFFSFFKRVFHGGPWKKPAFVGTKNIVDDVNLVLKPGKMYLLLGPPGSGKSSLLRAIAGLLKPDKHQHETVFGQVLYNGRPLTRQNRFSGHSVYIQNAFGYIDQLDKHAPRLTVNETFEFAYQCRAGGDKSIPNEDFQDTPEAQAFVEKMKKERLRTQVVLKALGLNDVKDTFVGNTFVRGISGGQRRRVTVGEMMQHRSPVLCGDEISTGLDAASTYDMVSALLHVGKSQKMTRIFSLLQPSPETVSLFDQVVLLGDSKILFAGPIDEVENYFAAIGYKSPEFMDVADFLQMVSTEDGATLYDPPPDVKARQPSPPTLDELSEMFKKSRFGEDIRQSLLCPTQYVWSTDDPGSMHGAKVSAATNLREVKHRYANNFFRSSRLNLKRFTTLWLRDKRVIIAGAVKNILMGVSVGGVYFNVDDPVSITGALFQAGLFIMLGAMQGASSLIEDRVIFYKHANANFYSAAPFVFGRSLSQIPQTTADTVTFATILFFFIGLADRNFTNFLVYLSVLLVFAILMSQQLALFASFASASTLQVYNSGVILFLTLFQGYILAPDVIPNYYVWIYWWSPYAWAYRALILNEFLSGRWGNDAEQILFNLGFVYNGETFGSEWIGYAFAYMIPYLVLCAVGVGVGLHLSRKKHEGEGGTAQPPKELEKQEDEDEDENFVDIPFKPVNLSFQDICYEVTASTTKQQLKLLHEVNGVFRAGRLCALMGSSGAGKTTLMDVIAMRKSSGVVTGDVRLNGWEQDAVTFRRCSGYVEQFDVQSPELTVRETILFSARLRLDPAVVTTDEETTAFVDHVMKDAELTSLADTPVGTDEDGGLSFEQKKRVSIAVELAASPSLIFLDEPTSGLDSRSALLVVKTLRKIADSGRTICATIHQPSSQVFDMFDDLLLLKKGGKTVFFGELGKESCRLLHYFESRGAKKCELGENPANWMLRVITDEKLGDLAETYKESAGFSDLCAELNEIKEDPDPEQKIEYDSEFARTRRVRQRLIARRLRTIYWRSPAYNLSRLLAAIFMGAVLAICFVTERKKEVFSESDMRGRLSVIFLSFVIMGITAILGVLPVMTKIRDMFYRQRASGMYDSASIGWALGTAEKWFIVLTCTLFTTVFLGVSGIVDAGSTARTVVACVIFWGFYTFNYAIYSYFGQCFVCLVKPMATALILSSVFIGLNNFFAGLVVRPQLMVGGFYALPYYIAPGHYVYEGLVTSLFADDTRNVTADVDSEFEDWLVAEGQCTPPEICQGTVWDFVYVFFGGEFVPSHTGRNAIILGGFLIFARVATFLCLKYIRFSD